MLPCPSHPPSPPSDLSLPQLGFETSPNSAPSIDLEAKSIGAAHVLLFLLLHHKTGMHHPQPPPSLSVYSSSGERSTTPSNQRSSPSKEPLGLSAQYQTSSAP